VKPEGARNIEVLPEKLVELTGEARPERGEKDSSEKVVLGDRWVVQGGPAKPSTTTVGREGLW